MAELFSDFIVVSRTSAVGYADFVDILNQNRSESPGHDRIVQLMLKKKSATDPHISLQETISSQRNDKTSGGASLILILGKKWGDGFLATGKPGTFIFSQVSELISDVQVTPYGMSGEKPKTFSCS